MSNTPTARDPWWHWCLWLVIGISVAGVYRLPEILHLLRGG